jgi:predicted HicB family RNase H-like nuclease
MAKRDRYVPGPDVDEVLRDSAGRVVDDAYVDAAVADAITTVRGRGRPSLSHAGESPLLRVRISKELDQAVRRAAENADESRSEWVRHILDEAVHRAS